MKIEVPIIELTETEIELIKAMAYEELEDPIMSIIEEEKNYLNNIIRWCNINLEHFAQEKMKAEYNLSGKEEKENKN